MWYSLREMIWLFSALQISVLPLHSTSGLPSGGGTEANLNERSPQKSFVFVRFIDPFVTTSSTSKWPLLHR